MRRLKICDMHGTEATAPVPSEDDAGKLIICAISGENAKDALFAMFKPSELFCGEGRKRQATVAGKCVEPNPRDWTHAVAVLLWPSQHTRGREDFDLLLEYRSTNWVGGFRQ